uniref:Peptidase M12B propeptide domain-containing protein n=1 Tax=Accipiter nisus TaxID=211598 RepID=A0A8B9MGI3_9AVES
MGRRWWGGFLGGRAPLHLLLLCHAWALPPPPREAQALLPARLPAPPGQLALRLAAFGRSVVLRLRPDAAFLAPRFRLQRLGGRRGAPRTWARRGCFYTGAVEGNPDAPAVLSRCGGGGGGGGGLRAAFYLDGAAYELQPLGHPSPGPPWRGLHRLQRRAPPPGAHPPRAAAAAAGSGEPGAGNREPLRRRAKRFVSQARYVETLLVADASMVSFYGEDVEVRAGRGLRPPAPVPSISPS